MSKNKRHFFLTWLLYSNVLAGLILAYVGLISSSGEFFRAAWVLFLGIPGLVILVLAILALRATSESKKKTIALFDMGVVAIIAIISFFGWYQTHKLNTFYSTFYGNIQNGMTHDQVRKLASGKYEQCTQSLSREQCLWNNASYSDDGVLIGESRQYVVVNFGPDGLVASKDRSGF